MLELQFIKILISILISTGFCWSLNLILDLPVTCYQLKYPQLDQEAIILDLGCSNKFEFTKWDNIPFFVFLTSSVNFTYIVNKRAHFQM